MAGELCSACVQHGGCLLISNEAHIQKLQAAQLDDPRQRPTKTSRKAPSHTLSKGEVERKIAQLRSENDALVLTCTRNATGQGRIGGISRLFSRRRGL